MYFYFIHCYRSGLNFWEKSSSPCLNNNKFIADKKYFLSNPTIDIPVYFSQFFYFRTWGTSRNREITLTDRSFVTKYNNSSSPCLNNNEFIADKKYFSSNPTIKYTITYTYQHPQKCYNFIIGNYT
jgi:hypothetical protein